MWPFKKKKPEEPTEERKPITEERKPITIRGKWQQLKVCHCGQYGDYDVCPKCGHQDKWEEMIGCIEYEFDYKAYYRDYSFSAFYSGHIPPNSNYESNHRVIRWTPEDCPVKEPS